MLTRRSFLAFATLVLMATTAGSASADFVPGRIRPGFRADMQAVSAAGIFENVKSALLVMNFEDGKSAPVSLSITLPNGTSRTYPIRSVTRSFCGDRYVAVSQGMGPAAASLELVDYSRATCERVIPHIWEATYRHGTELRLSEIQLVGNPETIYVTL